MREQLDAMNKDDEYQIQLIDRLKYKMKDNQNQLSTAGIHRTSQDATSRQDRSREIVKVTENSSIKVKEIFEREKN